MDCSNARLLLSFAGREGKELAPPDQHDLETHIEGCPDCLGLVRAERQADRVLGRAMLAVSVPKGLRGRILQTVAATRRPRYWPWVAAAASVLLGIGLAGFFYLRQEPEVQVASVFEDIDHRTGSNPEIVEKWFAAQGFRIVAPRMFQYTKLQPSRGAYLETFDVAVIDGHKTPHLLFHFVGDREHAAAVAHVYVMPARLITKDRDLKKLDTRIPGSNHIVELLPYPADGEGAMESVYVVIYSNTVPTLDPFKDPAFVRPNGQ